LYSYLDQATPANAVNSRTLADFTANSMSISGTADSLSTINVYIARLKATDYHLDGDSGGDKQAFTDVTLASFGRDAKTASYTITLNFDSAIFSEANDVSLVIAPEAKTSEGTGQ
jgi:hypothetical protein